jgi:hypothetical protein
LRGRARSCGDHGIVAEDHSRSRTTRLPRRVRFGRVLRWFYAVRCVHATDSAHNVGKLHRNHHRCARLNDFVGGPVLHVSDREKRKRDASLRPASADLAIS